MWVGLGGGTAWLWKFIVLILLYPPLDALKLSIKSLDEMYELLSVDSNDIMWQSAVISMFNLPNLGRLLLSDAKNFVPAYERGCPKLIWDEFVTIVDWLENGNGHLSQLFLGYNCLEKLTFKRNAQSYLWSHGQTNIVIDHTSISLEDWIFLLSRSTPIRFNRWCLRTPSSVLTSPLLEQTQLALHMSFFCLFRYYDNCGLVRQALDQQLLTTSDEAVSRLLLTRRGSKKKLSLSNLEPRIQDRSHSSLGAFNFVFFHRVADRENLVINRALAEASLSDSHKAILFRMWLNRRDLQSRSVPKAFATINFDLIPHNEYRSLVRDLFLFTSHLERRRDVVGLDEEEIARIIGPQIKRGKQCSLNNAMPTKTQLMYYRAKNLSFSTEAEMTLWTALDANGLFPLFFSPLHYLPFITWDRLQNTLERILTVDNSKYIVEGGSSFRFIRARSKVTDEEIADLVSILIYSHVRFQRPIAYLAPLYVFIIQTKNKDRRSQIILEEYSMESVIHPQAETIDTPQVKKKKRRCKSVLAIAHIGFLSQGNAIKCQFNHWGFDTVMYFGRFLKMLSEPDGLEYEEA